MVVNGSKVFAALNDPPRVLVYEYKNNLWAKVSQFKTAGEEDVFATIAVLNDTILFSSADQNIYHVYSLHGKLLNVFTVPLGRNILDEHYWFLCDTDGAGNVLVADQMGDNIHVITAQRKLTSVKLQPPAWASAETFSRGGKLCYRFPGGGKTAILGTSVVQMGTFSSF